MNFVNNSLHFNMYTRQWAVLIMFHEYLLFGYASYGLTEEKVRCNEFILGHLDSISCHGHERGEKERKWKM
jgi:hypothetical protein